MNYPVSLRDGRITPDKLNLGCGSRVVECCFWHVDEPGDMEVQRVAEFLPLGNFRRIVIKPNWVKHEERPEFPASSLVTSPTVIGVVIESCLLKYPDAESITVGDVPLQSCQWDDLEKQAGILKLREKYGTRKHPRIRFCDWRQECYLRKDGFLEPAPNPGGGDPLGCREVVLDEDSFLESVSGESNRFRVSDYDGRETARQHNPGRHRYLVAGSVLDCDLFINVPKLKTHQKAGLTCALKNLVGINVRKAYLVHHRQGRDDYASDGSRLVRFQVVVRELLQKRARLVFRGARMAWLLIRRWAGIQTVSTRKNLKGRLYIGAGSWYGNDTLWRMIYDLNWIIRYAPREGGALCPVPQRAFIVVMDALVAGEGDGPLQALPVPLGLLGVADNPFMMDLVCARMMGFDWRKIPVLDNMSLFKADSWGALRPDSVGITVDGHPYRSLDAVPVLHHFIPPPGWKGHIEATSGDGLDESRKGAGHA